MLTKNDTKALLSIKLATGRHHQIRVQTAHAGWPLVGDRKYNFKANMKPGNEQMGLCSYKLGFHHPVTKKKLEFEFNGYDWVKIHFPVKGRISFRAITGDMVDAKTQSGDFFII